MFINSNSSLLNITNNITHNKKNEDQNSIFALHGANAICSSYTETAKPKKLTARNDDGWNDFDDEWEKLWDKHDRTRSSKKEPRLVGEVIDEIINEFLNKSRNTC